MAPSKSLCFFASTNSKQAKMQLMNEVINHSVFILSIDARECRNADFAKSSKVNQDFWRETMTFTRPGIVWQGIYTELYLDPVLFSLRTTSWMEQENHNEWQEFIAIVTLFWLLLLDGLGLPGDRNRIRKNKRRCPNCYYCSLAIASS